MSKLDATIARRLGELLDAPPSQQQLTQCLVLLAKWRSQLIFNTLTKRDGHRVRTGPFQGMEYADRATEGALLARMIGCYEASLEPVLEEIISGPYRRIIDIGCAEGYYAVGLARRMPQASVSAHDQSEQAQASCRRLAEANGVAGRVSVGGLFGHADFDICTAEKTAVICDIEGAEDALLDPEKAPGLKAADILVETHDVFCPGTLDNISTRFAASHRISRIDRGLKPDALPDWMEGLSDLDRLLALWEWRIGPTPWLWMTAKTS